MEVARSDLQRQKKLYMTGMGVSLLIHLIIVLIALFAPHIGFKQQFAELKSYKVRMISADQLGNVPSAEKKPKPFQEPRGTSSKSSSAKDLIPVYPVKKIGVNINPGESPKAEIKKLDMPKIDSKPKQNRETAEEWEKLVPNVTEKHTQKPITQRKEFIQDSPESKGDSKRVGTTSNGKETEGATGEKVSEETRSASSKGKQGSEDGSKGNTSGAESSGSSSSEEYGLARKLYYSEVWKAIQSQWALPVDLLNRGDLEAIVVVKVKRDGTIMDVKFEKKSGNEIFDSSVWKAIQKANPLPPFPKTYSPPSEEIGIRFRPKDLMKQ